MLFDAFCASMADRKTGAEDGSAAWIVALSGGLDSTVLLDLACRYRDAVDPRQPLFAAHLNHRLRGDASDGDETHCRAVCESRKVELFCERVDVSALAADESMGLEEAGRAARHRFFARLCARLVPARILLAHHADDQVETVLMHLLRGCDLHGLGGMRQAGEFVLEAGRSDTPPSGFSFVRPLLCASRLSLEGYARERGLAWREDASNRDPRFLRNRIRHEVLPLLESLQPGLRHRLLDLSARAGLADTELDVHAGRWLAAHQQKRDGGVWLPVASGVLPATCVRAIRLACRHRLHLPLPDGGACQALLDLILSGRTGAVLQLAGGLRVRRESDGLFLYAAGNEPLPPEGEVVLPDAVPFSLEALNVCIQGAWRTVTSPGDVPAEDKDNPHVEWLDADALSFPLTLRARRDGDTFHPLGAPGAKKVKDFLIDRKVPQREKAAVRVLCDATGPVWVWPHRLEQRVALHAGSRRALRMEMS